MEYYQNKLKENVIMLINENELDKAKKLVAEYDDIVKCDIDVYSIRGAIAIMEGAYEEAETILLDGLSLLKDNFDLLYNLAYLYEIQEKYELAYKYYMFLTEVGTGNNEVINEVKGKLQQFEKLESIKELITKEKYRKKSVPAIIITTSAYNSEKYIIECVESVLTQSFTDFEWVILDNGCTDGTSEILKQYAEKDSRIKLHRNERNSYIYNVRSNPEYDSYVRNSRAEYWCTLDSDDFIHRDFLKDLYILAKRNNADIAVAGTEMFEESNPKQRGTRCPPNFNINDITKLGDIFPQVYGCFRPIWGKLFKVDVRNRRTEYRTNYPIKVSNGGDTITCIDCLKFSKSVVGINKVLHYYRVRKTSFYQTHVDKYRYNDYKTIYIESKKLLESWNRLNETNLKFIGNVFYSSIKDCMIIAAEASSSSIEERVQVIEAILSDGFVIEVLNNNGLMPLLFEQTRMCLKKIVTNYVNNRHTT